LVEVRQSWRRCVIRRKHPLFQQSSLATTASFCLTTAESLLRTSILDVVKSPCIKPASCRVATPWPIFSNKLFTSAYRKNPLRWHSFMLDVSITKAKNPVTGRFGIATQGCVQGNAQMKKRSGFTVCIQIARKQKISDRRSFDALHVNSGSFMLNRVDDRSKHPAFACA